MTIRFIPLLAAVLLSTPQAFAQTDRETATLKMRFVYDDDPPYPQKLSHPLAAKPRAWVDEKTKGIRDFVVSVYTSRRGTELQYTPQRPKKRKLEIRADGFNPKVLIARSQDSVEVVNRTAFGYQIRFSFFSNQPQDVAVAPGAKAKVQLRKSESAPIPVSSLIHAWMNAQLVVVDHPFAAISDETGVVEISGLPANREIIFRPYHSQLDLHFIDPENKLKMEKRKFTVKLRPGTNDLGEIKVSARAFF